MSPELEARIPGVAADMLQDRGFDTLCWCLYDQSALALCITELAARYWVGSDPNTFKYAGSDALRIRFGTNGHRIDWYLAYGFTAWSESLRDCAIHLLGQVAESDKALYECKINGPNRYWGRPLPT